MSPKLYTIEWSPPVRAVLLTERALGIKLEHVPIDLPADENLKPEFLKINPQHTVPTLIDDDGTVICDSHSIMMYLVDKYGKDDSLYPKDLKQRSLIHTRMFFEAGCVFSVSRRIIQLIWHKGSKGVSEADIEATISAYNFLNKFLEGEQWVAGKQMTIADFSLISSIASLHDSVPVDPKFTNVLAWMHRMEQLPYYDANSVGLKDLRDFLNTCLKN